MNHRSRHLIAVVAAITLAGAACSSSDDPEPDGTTAPSDETNESDDGSSEEGGSAELEKFCDDVEAFAEASQDLIDDPANADAQAVATQGTELASAANALATSITPEETARLDECIAVLASIGP